MQPGRDGRVTAEAIGPAERGDHGVLQSIRRLLRIAESPDGHSPESLPVPLKKLSESVGITRHMSLQELGIRRAAGRGSRAALTRQVRGIGLLVVRIRRFLPPSRYRGGHTRRTIRGHLVLLITS
jgi:hypothetical protein